MAVGVGVAVVVGVGVGVEVVVGVGVGVAVVVGVAVAVVVVVGVAVAVVVGVGVAVELIHGGIMKKLVQVQEVAGEGLVGMMGQRITVWCMNYIYTGDLVGVNDDCILLDNAGIVYETGPLGDKKWGDMQALPHACYIMKRAIESFMVLK